MINDSIATVTTTTTKAKRKNRFSKSVITWDTKIRLQLQFGLNAYNLNRWLANIVGVELWKSDTQCWSKHWTYCTSARTITKHKCGSMSRAAYTFRLFQIERYFQLPNWWMQPFTMHSIPLSKRHIFIVMTNCEICQENMTNNNGQFIPIKHKNQNKMIWIEFKYTKKGDRQSSSSAVSSEETEIIWMPFAANI